jgi:hypothetical protein
VQYFTILDKNGDDRVYIEEVLAHCFPLVDAAAHKTLQKWLYPARGTSVLDVSARELVAECEKLVKQHPQAHNDTDLKAKLYNDLDVKRGVQKGGEHPHGIMCKSALIKLLQHNCSDFSSVLEGYQMHEPLGLVHESDIPNYFSATIFAITSAIQKLAKPTNQLLYRGFGTLNTPKDIQGKCFCEYGFFSTTSDEKMAKSYAGDEPNAFLFEIQPTTSTLAVVANVADYSQ